MPKYIDGFVLPLPKDKIDQYKSIAEQACAVWKEHGALDYVECVCEDPNAPEMISFSQLAGASDAETVIFAWIVYRSREHRDEVNAKVMADPRMNEMCGEAGPPFDCKRMAYSGFEVLVSAD